MIVPLENQGVCIFVIETFNISRCENGTMLFRTLFSVKITGGVNRVEEDSTFMGYRGEVLVD